VILIVLSFYPSLVPPPPSIGRPGTAKTKCSKPNVDFDADKYETKQIFCCIEGWREDPDVYCLPEGTRRRTNPVYLTGYGGFNISNTPSFSATYAS
jgi:prolyl oligopeptidase PreP (S9A serine peptidase family)